VFYCFLLYSSTTSIRINDVNKLCSPLFHFFTLKKQTLSSPSTNTFKEKKYRLLIYYIVRNLPREGACTNRQKTLVPIKIVFITSFKYLTLTFCSFIKSLKIKLKWVCETTGRNTYARVPSRKSSTPPDWDFSNSLPPHFPNTRTKNPSPKMLCF
jgi:hypothetical protein